MSEVTNYVRDKIGQVIPYADIYLNYCYDKTLEIVIKKGNSNAKIIYPVEDELTTPLEIKGFLRSQVTPFRREFRSHAIYLGIEGNQDDYIDFRDGYI